MHSDWFKLVTYAEYLFYSEISNQIDSSQVGIQSLSGDGTGRFGG